MIDHTGVVVTDFIKSKAWYEAALAPIGYACLMQLPPEVAGEAKIAGFGETATQKPDFWVTAFPGRSATKPPLHIAFRVETRAAVDAFYKAALAAGGKDNGPPGIRPHYHPNYYGAFVRDPDGHNIEAVCHKPA
ncbi:MAG: VOC family protein [Proteobacteria bacterium]|nr:VOC family protein [Pseudomonadota bacterium]